MMEARTPAPTRRGSRPPTPGTSTEAPGIGLGGDGASVLELQLLGLLDGRAQPDGQIVGDRVAAEADHRGVADGAVEEDGDVGRAAADVEEQHAERLLVLVEDRLGRGQRLQDQRADDQPGPGDPAPQVAHRGASAR